MPEACNFIKKVTLAQVFSCEFCKFFKNIFFYRTPPVGASGYTFEFIIPPMHSVCHGSESVSYLRFKIPGLIPSVNWQTDSLSGFKKIKKM